MGMFSGKNMADQQGSKGGVYFTPGTYVCRLNKVGIIDPQRSVKAFVAEFEVLDVIDPDPEDKMILKKRSRPSVFVQVEGEKYKQYESTFLGNISDCLRGILACNATLATGEVYTPEMVPYTDAIADECIEEGDPLDLTGTIVGVHAYQAQRKDGGPLTKLDYFVPDDIAEYAEAA